MIESETYIANCPLSPVRNETIWYQWSRGGIPISNDNVSGVLTIPSVNRTDAGNYTCRARNVAGSVTSNHVKLIVHCKY